MFHIRHRHTRDTGRKAEAPVTNLRRQAVKGWTLSPRLAFAVLLVFRLLSAWLNIIHDCDEVFNYWEPLHYLLYGYGLQTWEYSAKFALRPYIYLLLHSVVAAPAASWFGSGTGKLAVFYLTRAALATASAIAETALYRATQRYAGRPAAHYLLALLCLSSGMFSASTGLLPSSFTMLPASISVGLAGLVMTVTPMVLLDRMFYGTWTLSLWNFVRYNVGGGGDSALYGVEGTSFYLRNGANNLNLVLPLAFAYPAVALLQLLKISGGELRPRLLASIAPLFVWLAAITALPHKEERFLFVVYPLTCLAAAATLEALPRLVYSAGLRCLPRRSAQLLANAAPIIAVLLIGLLSLARSAALVSNYGAPLRVYSQLPEVDPAAVGSKQIHVCVGDEWHRFPSSFFLPSPAYRPAFVKSGFHGLLPRPFDAAAGGTAAAPTQLNDRNREEPANYWANTTQCDYLIRLDSTDKSLYDPDHWDLVTSHPFVEASKSPALYRALYVPGLSSVRNSYVQYQLLKQRKPER
ncbi:hypothetical protein WJX72_002581 [[Myrmecia] bisecta]|uniref:Mannosyltransferase n=1 Tax=[Myrmecia] bisecta TaxID=41462 RepID=A0AAW1Q1P2_9CHLO